MRKNTPTKNFVKAERIFARLLQDNHISFKAHVIIGGREIDFLIGKFAIEIDGHAQDGTKNSMLVDLGYTPIHFTNEEVYLQRNKLIKFLL